MSLLNPLASAAQASHSPSRADGIPRALEDELRVWGCRLIQDAGTLLRLPQAAMASAQLLFQRFWYVSSFRDFSIKVSVTRCVEGEGGLWRRDGSCERYGGSASTPVEGHARQPGNLIR